MQSYTDLSFADQIKDGDELRNINCYEYLKNITKNISEHAEVAPLVKLRNFFIENPNYQTNYAYGNLYTDFLLDYEEHLNDLEKYRKNIIATIKKSKALIEQQLKNVANATKESENKIIQQSIEASEQKIKKDIQELHSIDAIINC